MAKSKLAPEHMSTEQLWRMLRSRLLALRLAINEGEPRQILIERLSVIESCADELPFRDQQLLLEGFGAGLQAAVDAADALDH